MKTCLRRLRGRRLPKKRVLPSLQREQRGGRQTRDLWRPASGASVALGVSSITRQSRWERESPQEERSHPRRAQGREPPASPASRDRSSRQGGSARRGHRHFAAGRPGAAGEVAGRGPERYPPPARPSGSR